MKIERRYVTFEQAKLLKDKEFTGFFSAAYSSDGTYLQSEQYGAPLIIQGGLGKLLNPDVIPHDKRIYAPEQWEVIEWLRLKYEIHILVVPYYAYNILKGYIWNTGGLITMQNINSVLKRSGEHSTPQQAYSAAFDYILKELI